MRQSYWLISVLGVLASLACAPVRQPSGKAPRLAAPDDGAAVATPTPVSEQRIAEYWPTIEEPMLQDVFFDFDQAGIRTDQIPTLLGDLEIMQRRLDLTIRIEGHCDERGTAQYNLALGERRAAAVKSYLVQSGVAPSRIETVSYGKERPFAQGNSEEDLAKNRRAHFLYLSWRQSAPNPSLQRTRYARR